MKPAVMLLVLTTTVSLLPAAASAESPSWQGSEWIGGGTAMRREFQLPAGEIMNATALASAPGCYDLTVNGANVTSALFEPGWGSLPPTRMLYRRYEISSLLLPAQPNAIGVKLGYCKYGYVDAFCSGAHASHSACRAFRMTMLVHYADGSTFRLSTQASSWWQTTAADPIRYSHLYHGETFNASLHQPNWDKAGFLLKTDPRWQPAKVYANASKEFGSMSEALAPPVQVSEAITAGAIWHAQINNTTVWVFDFGIPRSGFAVLNVSGLSKGTRLLLKYSEVLHNAKGIPVVPAMGFCINGTGKYNSNWTPSVGPADCKGGEFGGNVANQTDVYICKGGRQAEIFKPLFSYKSYRYVQLEGWPSTQPPPTQHTLTALFIHSHLKETGTIHFHNHSQLNALQRAIRYTTLSNLFQHPTDCPSREKRGWMGDAAFAAQAETLNFDMTSLYDGFLQTMQDTQELSCGLPSDPVRKARPPGYECCSKQTKPSWANNYYLCDFEGVSNFSDHAGSLPDVIPSTHPPYSGGFPGDPSWVGAATAIPFLVLRQANDSSLARRYYHMAKQLVDFEARHGDEAAGGLARWAAYGDLGSLDPGMDQTYNNVSKYQVSSFSYIRSISQLLVMANATGRTEDVTAYTDLLGKMKQAYFDTYFHSGDGYGPSITANAMAVMLDLYPPSEKEFVEQCLTAGLRRSLNDSAIQAGYVGSSIMLQAALKISRPDLAFQLATSTDKHTWLGMLNGQDADGRDLPGTFCESRACASNSHNHASLSSSIGQYLFTIAGIAFDISSPEVMVFKPEAFAARFIGGATVHFRSSTWSWHLSTTDFSLNATTSAKIQAHLLIPKIVTEHALELVDLRNGCGVWSRGCLAGVKKRCPAARSTIAIAGTSRDAIVATLLVPGRYSLLLVQHSRKVCGRALSIQPIDRTEVVRRWNPRTTQITDGQTSVLTVGNGRFAFNMDLTGMQTFNQTNKYLNILSDWGYHTFPWALDPSFPSESKNETRGPWERLEWTRFAANGRVVRYPGANCSGAQGPICSWLARNPARWNLGQIGFRWDNGSTIQPDSVMSADQELDMYSGIVTSRFQIKQPKVVVEVITSAAGLVGGIDGSPSPFDTVSFRVAYSVVPAPIRVHLSFPAPSSASEGTGGNWSQETASLHRTDPWACSTNTLCLQRTAHQDRYNVACRFINMTTSRVGTHAWSWTPVTNETELVCSFATEKAALAVGISARVAERNARASWMRFWSAGAALDLAAVQGPSARELERRIVQSRYLLRAMESSSKPPQETGLVSASWYGKFNHEMRLWHHAHNVLWGRSDLVQLSDAWYTSILDNATSFAAFEGYAGARWPKAVGLANRNYSNTLPPSKAGKAEYWEWPVAIGVMLTWQQPHPILMAEMQYRACIDQACKSLVVERMKRLVEDTATFMASYVQRAEDGVYHMGAPSACAEEGGEAVGGGGTLDAPNHVYDCVFEVEYWRFGLRIANKWRSRAGLQVNSTWAAIADALALPATVQEPVGGTTVYNFHAGCANAFDPAKGDASIHTQWHQSHPTMLAAHGLLPGSSAINKSVMNQTLSSVLAQWDWTSGMGWDYPLMALTAARLGRSDVVRILLFKQNDSNCGNQYLMQGWAPMQGQHGPYFPANGGLLLAVGMAVGGWAGAQPLAGLPEDWRPHVRAEGFRPYL